MATPGSAMTPDEAILRCYQIHELVTVSGASSRVVDEVEANVERIVEYLTSVKHGLERERIMRNRRNEKRRQQRAARKTMKSEVVVTVKVPDSDFTNTPDSSTPVFIGDAPFSNFVPPYGKSCLFYADEVSAVSE